MNEEQTVMALVRLERKIDQMSKVLEALVTKVQQTYVRIDTLAARASGQKTSAQKMLDNMMTDEELDMIDRAELEGWKRSQLSKEV